MNTEKTLFHRTKVSLLLLLAVSSCTPVIHATSAGGEILEARGEYGYVRLDAVRGRADYNTFLEVYFGYPVKRNERVLLVTRSYLDSLCTCKKQVILGLQQVD